MPNYYETLDLQPNASISDVKKQFYKLSKANHPDLHPSDSTAAQRFVKISEAYATLGSPDKRARYDRDFLRSTHQTNPQSSSPSGSYSSASPGGRPASGLSRRRTQFRGPPPSFYRSGGWGQQGEKRAEHASKASHAHESSASQAGPGMGPSGFSQGFDNDVPHFDQRGHYQTHSDIERTRHKARRKRVVREGDEWDDRAAAQGPSTLFNFFMITGVLTFIVGFSGALAGISQNSSTARRQKEQRTT